MQSHAPDTRGPPRGTTYRSDRCSSSKSRSRVRPNADTPSSLWSVACGFFRASKPSVKEEQVLCWIWDDSQWAEASSPAPEAHVVVCQQFCSSPSAKPCGTQVLPYVQLIAIQLQWYVVHRPWACKLSLPWLTFRIGAFRYQTQREWL